MRAGLAVVIAGLLVAGCQQQESAPPDDAAASTAVRPAPVEGATAAATEEAAKTAPEVTLTANSIILIGAVEGRGTATTLEFGRDRKTVLDVLAFGFPKPKLSQNDECGAGKMDFAAFGPLMLNFLDGKFVGWLAEGRDGVVTVDGIRPGITIADLKRERPVERLDSTLDGEFEYVVADGTTIGGFAKGKGDAAVIQSLHAGVNCFFR